jgi:hypothetical protein
MLLAWWYFCVIIYGGYQKSSTLSYVVSYFNEVFTKIARTIVFSIGSGFCDYGIRR